MVLPALQARVEERDCGPGYGIPMPSILSYLGPLQPSHASAKVVEVRLATAP